MAATAADHFNATMVTAADNNSEGNLMAMCHGVPLASMMEVVYQGVALALPCWALDLMAHKETTTTTAEMHRRWAWRSTGGTIA